MPRPTRIQTPHLLRHVMSRGNGRMTIFVDDQDYRLFLYLLEETCEKFAVECWSYCVMPNHYHAALWPTLPNISEAIRHLNGEYAKAWNRRHGKLGHTFQGRFKDQIVQDDHYLLTLLRYIALNPVRAGLTDRAANWRWGSYRALAGTEPAPPFLAMSTVLSAFGSAEDTILHERFARYVTDPEVEATVHEDRLRAGEHILGDRAFKARVREREREEGSDTGQTRVRLKSDPSLTRV